MIPGIRRRGRSLRSPISTFVWAATALEIASFALIAAGLLPEPPGTPSGSVLIFLVLVASFGLVGARIVTRQPRNSVGWLVWAQAGVLTLSGIGQSYALLSIRRFDGGLPGTAVLAWAASFMLLLFLVGNGLVLPLLFPDGRLPSRRWRWAMANALAATGLVVVGSGQVFLPGPIANFPMLENPFPVPALEALSTIGAPLGAALVLAGLPLAVAAQVGRYRHGSGAERQQVKWFAAAVAVPALLLAVSIALQTVEAVWVLTIASLGLVPVAIGVAILRYRLYEIDRLISRTISWLAITLILAVIFGGAVVGLQMLLSRVAGDDTIAVAASTLLAAGLFRPLQRRVQHAVDRRFDRARYSGGRLAAEFGGQMRDETDIARASSNLRDATLAAMHPASAVVWLRNGRP